MSKETTSRRAILARGAVAMTGSIGVVSRSARGQTDGVGSQQTKAHYIEFSVEDGDGSAQYFVSVPDPEPSYDGLESDDEIREYDTYTTVDGSLNGNFSPRQDEIDFDGSLDDNDFDWNADPEVRVIIDGDTVQSG